MRQNRRQDHCGGSDGIQMIGRKLLEVLQDERLDECHPMTEKETTNADEKRPETFDEKVAQ